MEEDDDRAFCNVGRDVRIAGMMEWILKATESEGDGGGGGWIGGE